ncbi:MAG: DMT family transporter [Oscillospiraceae bacterium]
MERKGAALIVAAGLLWGTIGFFMRMMSLNGSTFQLTCFVRMVFAFLFMFVLTVIRSGIKAFRIDRRTLLMCLLLGVVCHGIYNVMYSAAVDLLGMAVSCVLMNSAPVFTALASMLFFGERPTPLRWTALAVNIVGCILAAAGEGADAAAVSIAGILCGLGSGLCYGMTAIFGKLAGGETDSFVVSTYSYLFAVPVGLAALAFSEPVQPNAGILGWGALLALIPTGIAYLLYYGGLRRIKDTCRVPVLASGECVVAALIGTAFFRETLSVVNIAGIALVLFSIFMMGRGERK